MGSKINLSYAIDNVGFAILKVGFILYITINLPLTQRKSKDKPLSFLNNTFDDCPPKLRGKREM
jgi:hypothetical protein